jgi:hypothetical protein
MTNPKTKLGCKAQLSVDNYINNVIVDKKEGYTWYDAIRDGGYADTTAKSNAKEIWDRVGVQDQINAARAAMAKKSVYNRQQRQKFWTDMMLEGKTDADKLRASELLGRSEADFTDNISNTVPDQSLTLTKDEQVEALRAQIRLLTDSEDAGTAVAI